MTIAEFVPEMEQSEALKNQLQGKVPEGSFLCDRIAFIVPGRAGSQPAQASECSQPGGQP